MGGHLEYHDLYSGHVWFGHRGNNRHRYAAGYWSDKQLLRWQSRAFASENGVIASQREDGWFGPRANLRSPRRHSTGKPDLWPNMPMLSALQSYYEYSGDERVIRLMTIHRNTANWTEGIPNWHNVNITQALRGPATYYLQSKEWQHLAASERNYQTVWGMYGQVPGGMFGGDEDCRPGFDSARQAVETSCA